MDSAIIPLSRHSNLYLVQTVDFFYPLLDDPIIMGKIALANVLSDVYAVGVTNIDKLNLIISSPTEFSENERNVIVPMIIDGFKEAAKKANCRISVKNIAINPWCFIGGIASSVCHQNEIIMPNRSKPGDLIILTKPLGTQLATNSYIWMQENSENYRKIKNELSDIEIKTIFNTAVKSMTLLNKSGAELMHKYKANGATDVTGFGILGHAKNLVEFQKEQVDFILEKLPIIKNVKKIAEILGQSLKLLSGKAVETSGGLLLCLPEKNGKKFCEDFQISNGYHPWIIGKVITGSKKAMLVENIITMDVEI